MKKFAAAVMLAAFCVVSASAVGIGFRGDVDFGVGTLKNNDQKATFQKSEQLVGGETGVWFDLPFVDLKVLSVGFRPEAAIAFNQGVVLGGDATLRTTDFNVPLFVDAAVNLGIVRVSAGIGPYVSWSFATNSAKAKLAGKEVTYEYPNVGWSNPTWGLAAFAQAGIRVGAGFLLFDVRANAPFTDNEIKSLVDNQKETVTSKRYRIDLGIGYEFVL